MVWINIFRNQLIFQTIFLHWSNFHFPNKFSLGILNSFIVAFKLSPSKLNLSLFYPLPYKRTVWYYEKANTELIRRAIDQFDWGRALSNVDKKVYFFTNKTLPDIIQNFIPHKTIICDDSDSPWINNEIKKLMVEKNLTFKSYCISKKNMILVEKFKALQNQLVISLNRPYWVTAVFYLQIYLNSQTNNLIR